MLSDLSYRTPALLCFPLLYYFLNIFARLTLISVSLISASLTDLILSDYLCNILKGRQGIPIGFLIHHSNNIPQVNQIV